MNTKKLKTRGWGKWLLGFAALIVVVVGLWSLFPVAEWTQAAIRRFDDWGYVGMAAYLALYVLLSSLTFPNTPLNIGAGVFFSYSIGFSLALTGAISSAVIVFLGRFVARDWVKTRIDRFPDGHRLLEAISEEGFKAVLLARLNPFIPASLKNYGFSVTPIPIAQFVFASLLGQIPVTAAHVYIGWAGGVAVMYGDAEFGPLEWGLIALGTAASIAMLAVIAWHGKRRLAAR